MICVIVNYSYHLLKPSHNTHTQGGIRCCDDVTMGQGAAGFGGKNCKKSSAKVKGSVVQNKKTGCHTIRSRDDSISRESVRFVSPLSGTCTDSTCGCKGCLDGTTCPTCSTAIELCNRPGSFLQLKGNVLSFSPAPENFCNTYTTESPCTANPTCLWESNMCKQQSVVDFMLETTFSVVPSKDFTGFLTIIKNEMTVVPDSRGLTVTESVAAPASASSWKLEVAMSKSSTEASIPLINIEVPQGGIEYKICQRPEGTKTWMELQTHTQQGYRTPTFLVAGTLNDAADGEGRGAASADDHCHDAPIWWLILLILLLCLCIALLAAKKYRNEVCVFLLYFNRFLCIDFLFVLYPTHSCCPQKHPKRRIRDRDSFTSFSHWAFEITVVHGAH